MSLSSWAYCNGNGALEIEPMDPHDVAFPDPSEIAPHAIAFARMMFAHAAFERELRSLVDAINPKKPRFGERPENKWSPSESSTGKIIILIKHHRGSDLPHIEQIKNVLNEAILPCRDRDFLAHGTWCCFNRRSLTLEVRGGVRWAQPELPPENRAYTVSDILKLARRFKDIEAELYKIRRSLEPKISEAELRAASSFLRPIQSNRTDGARRMHQKIDEPCVWSQNGQARREAPG
jgi:hypothetical protein